MNTNENESIGVHYERNVKTIIEQKIFILQMTELRSLLKIKPNFVSLTYPEILHLSLVIICHLHLV